MRPLSLLKRIWIFLNLDRTSVSFFYSLAVIHIALKMLLGLKIVLADGIGFSSLIAPPQSIVFASADIVLCYVLAWPAKWMEKKWKRGYFIMVFVLMIPFLFVNFIVHLYFRSFLTFGFIMCNGATVDELWEYTLAAVSLYPLLFVVVCIASTYLFFSRSRTHDPK